MADITNLVRVKGFHGAVEKPFQWHVWKVTLPVAAFAGAGPDDVTLPDRFDVNTRILKCLCQVVAPVTVATSLVLDIECAKVDSAGTVTPISNLQASIACQTASTTEAASGSTTFDDMLNDSAIIAGTQKGCINLEFTKTGAVSVAGEILVGILMGRIDY